MTCKSYDIPKTLVWEAWLHVKANQEPQGSTRRRSSGSRRSSPPTCTSFGIG